MGINTILSHTDLKLPVTIENKLMKLEQRWSAIEPADYYGERLYMAKKISLGLRWV